MELDDRALPIMRGQLDIWFGRQTSHAAAESQPSLFARIDGPVQPDLFEQADCQTLQGAKQCGAAFFEVDGQVFQKAGDYPDVELALCRPSCSQYSVREGCEIPSSIQHALMPLSGPSFKVPSSQTQTQASEFYSLDRGEHARLDGWGNRAVLPQPVNAVGRPLVGHI